MRTSIDPLLFELIFLCFDIFAEGAQAQDYLIVLRLMRTTGIILF